MLRKNVFVQKGLLDQDLKEKMFEPKLHKTPKSKTLPMKKLRYSKLFVVLFRPNRKKTF